MTNKIANALILIGCVIIAIFIWRTIEKLVNRDKQDAMIIEILSEQVKQDSIKAVKLRHLADSLQTVALNNQLIASIEHEARIDLLKKQQSSEGKKVLTATARETVQYFVASVDTGTKVAPELIIRNGDTLANISYMTLRKANVLFIELDYARQAIVEHRTFEDDLLGVIDDLNASANVYKAEADTWKESNEDLKVINKNLQATNDKDKKALKRSRLWNKILTGMLGLGAAKIIFF